MANIPLKSIQFPGLDDTYTVPSNAGELPYNKSATYPADTVGKALQNIGDSSAPAIIETAQGSIASFDDGADNIPVKDLVAEIVPLQSGSGDPSPSNVRAISGWTEANIFVAPIYVDGLTLNNTDNGAILGSYLKSDGSTSENGGYRVTEYIPINEGEVVEVAIGQVNAPSVCFYDKNHSFISGSNYNGDANPIKRTAPSGSAYCRVSMLNVSTMISVVKTTHTISFASAGTVYGGSIDVTTGVLTVDRAMVDLGDLNWILNSGTNRANSTDLDGSIVVPPSSQPADAIAEKYKMLATSGTLTLGTMAVLSSGGLDTLIAYYDGVNRPSGKFVYLLQTPQTYQLTPTEVKTLLKNNNVWADTGDVTVEYVADTKTFIENLVNA